MIVVTGGSGFIGSNLVAALDDDILVVDSFSRDQKWKNLVGQSLVGVMNKGEFLRRIREDSLDSVPDAIVHLGACSSTTETDTGYLVENNFGYSKELACYAVKHSVRFIYASSAAVYGDGGDGFSDDHDRTHLLKPQNPYGWSKLLFDQWALRHGFGDRIAGLRFFNVYGPHEAHKGSQRSAAAVFAEQALAKGTVRLFRSPNPKIPDAEMKRDFVWVGDCVEVIRWLLLHRDVNGIFNVGSGEARGWLDVAEAVFRGLSMETKVEFVDMPESVARHYQYYTKGDVTKLRARGYLGEPTKLEEGISQYVARL